MHHSNYHNSGAKYLSSTVPIIANPKIPKTKFSGTPGIPPSTTFGISQFTAHSGGTPTVHFNLNPNLPTMPPSPSNALHRHNGNSFFTILSIPQINSCVSTSLNPFPSVYVEDNLESHRKKHRHHHHHQHQHQHHHNHRRRLIHRKSNFQSMPHSSLIQSLNPFKNVNSNSDNDSDNPFTFSIINPSSNPVILFYTILDIPDELRDELRKINTSIFQDPGEYIGSSNSPKAASFNQLILFLTDPNYTNVEFQKMFLITFPSFSTPKNVLAGILTRYFADINETNCNIKDQNQLKQIRIIIIRIISAWLKLTKYQFTNDMMIAFEEFVKFLGKDPSCALQVTILTKDLNMLKGDNSGMLFTRKKHPPAILKPKKPNKIIDVHPIELARQISILHNQIFRKIGPMELLTAIWGKKKGGGSENVDSLTEHFDKFSRYVQFTVINGNNAKARANMFNFWVDTAIAFKMINNFHGIFAVICALTHRSVKRLKETTKIALKKMGRTKKRQYNELVDLCDLQNDFRSYRPALLSAIEPCVPFIGCLQRDLIYVQEGYPNEINGLTNVKKCEACYKLIKQVERLQNESYNFQEIDEIQNLIKNGYPALPDTIEMMKLSMEKEKKKSK
ncbi:RasGEF domain containing protein [Histomonas meleagridis]|uniref:RasGEF domain containing protein n=1 Tax=Histomonas meleagridis TaxID=135588 RepID=UPI00355A4698|nr:RasGEF domain containing protein [Histomonas meleagridis]KAH0805854.1 RasGEF domain containing protein [Histomonas meleagridis]